MDKEWEVEATIKINTTFFRSTKEEAEKAAHEYLSELCQGLYPDCCSNSYEIEDIYTYEEEEVPTRIEAIEAWNKRREGRNGK